MRNNNFYNSVSQFYDEMIGFEDSLQNRINIFGTLFSGRNIETAADVGCGSGLDTIALASLGCNVTGFDTSAEMIGLAEKNAKKKKVTAVFKNSGVDKIRKSEFNKYDLIISLGNALANINPALLAASLNNMAKMLKDGGLIVVQILNYDKILKEKPVVIGSKTVEENTIVRFYDYLPGSLSFYILKLNNKNPQQSSLYKTEIYPYKKAEIAKLFKEAKFQNLKFYGSLKLEKYEAGKSKDLIIAAVKNKK